MFSLISPLYCIPNSEVCDVQWASKYTVHTPVFYLTASKLLKLELRPNPACQHIKIVEKRPYGKIRVYSDQRRYIAESEPHSIEFW